MKPIKQSLFKKYLDSLKVGQNSIFFKMEDLTEQEHDLLSRKIFSEIGKSQLSNEKELYRIYLKILLENGIICPHPSHKKKFTKSNKWFKCEMCDCEVINELFVEEVVSVEKKTMELNKK